MATAEEKFEEEVKQMSREDKIDKLADIDCWDMQALCEYAEMKLRESYEDLCDADLNDEYMTMFDSDVCNYDDDEEEEVSFVCNNDTCPMTAWGINHHADCPQRS